MKCGKDVLDKTAKAQATRTKLHKLDNIKLKKFFASKDTIDHVKHNL